MYYETRVYGEGEGRGDICVILHNESANKVSSIVSMMAAHYQQWM